MNVLHRLRSGALRRPGPDPVVGTAAVQERLRLILTTLERPAPTDPTVLDAEVCAALSSEGADAVWLSLAVLRAELPEPVEVRALDRRMRLDGPQVVLDAMRSGLDPARLHRRVEVVTDRVLVDIHQLLRTAFTTGIQRVSQETVARWHRDHDVVAVAWTDDLLALRPVTRADLSASVREAALRSAGSTLPVDDVPQDHHESLAQVLVPWRCVYLLPELALDPPRTARTQALAVHARSRTGAIVFDLVPVTSAATTDEGVPADFARQLAAIRHFDRVAAISEATRTEYEGWRIMTSAMGCDGPEVRTVPLPGEAGRADPAAAADVRRRYADPELPLVLCVGSHEPRKNHPAVLHAAELAWRAGARFRLLLVGGNSWANEHFVRRLTELTAAGRPVEAVSGVSDAELWALYRLARLTIFPSLSEGFGLPVAESLAAGTPTITSDFGSMAEIAEGGGALLVDPRDDQQLGAALLRLVTDDDLHRRLRTQALGRPVRTWDDYARQTWAALVGPPDGT